MIFTERTSFSILLSAVFVLAGYLNLVFGLIGWILLCLCLICIIIERVSIPVASAVVVKRILPSKLAIGIENKITLSVTNRSKRNLVFTIKDEPPDEFEMRDIVFMGALARREATDFSYYVKPLFRGDFWFHNMVIEIKGPIFDFVRKRYTYRLEQPVKIYPNYRLHRNFKLIESRRVSGQYGAHRARRYGIGTEFESLRDYTPDDDYRRIDWNATARSGKLIALNYQQERSQTIFMMIDTGRLMGNVAFGLTKLDHAINACTLLTQICLEKGDRAGCMAFGSEVSRWIVPKKDLAQKSRIAESLYNVPLELVEPDYTRAFDTVKLRLRQRSLIVIFTEILDRYASQMLIENIRSLYPKHLALCVLMKDRELEAVLQAPLDNFKSGVRKSVTAELLHERDEAIAFIRSSGVLVADSLPENLNPTVINSYLDIKARGRL